jgi:HEAT repeat protein
MSTVVLALVLMGGTGAIRPQEAEPKTVAGRSLDEWLVLLESEDDSERARAMFALSSGGADTASELVSIVADDETGKGERETAIVILGLIGPEAEAAIPELRRALDEPEPAVRIKAADALSRIDSSAIEAAVPILEAGLQDAGTAVTSAQALARLGPQAARAVPALIEHLSEGSLDSRLLALYALGEIGPAAKPAIAVLEQLLDDGDERVRKNARTALEKIKAEPDQQ